MPIHANPLTPNYESVFGDALLQALMSRYGTTEEARAFEVLLLRAAAVIRKAPISLWTDLPQMGRFLAADLHLPSPTPNGLQYHGETITFLREPINSLANIWDEWLFRFGQHIATATIRESTRLNALVGRHQTLAMAAHRTARLRRRDPRYVHHYLHAYLALLTEAYELRPLPPGRMPGIDYGPLVPEILPTLEERMARLVARDQHEGLGPATFSERALEEFVSDHLDLVEDGLTLVGRQVRIPGGRLDILARDRRERSVIMELKVVADADLLWQALHYPSQYRDLGGVSPPRIVVIAPPLPDSLVSPLLALSQAEIFSYTAQHKNGRIQHLALHPVRLDKLAECS